VIFCIPVCVCPLIPLAPCSPCGSRGSLGVLMPERKDGTPGLANKPDPARARAPEVCAGSAGVLPACAPEVRAPRKGSVPGRDARAFPCACAPSSPLPPSPTRGEGGVWASCCLKRKMARQGLPTNLLLQGRAPEGCAGCAGVPPACAPEARAPRRHAGAPQKPPPAKART
jgi:hypothetical protein